MAKECLISRKTAVIECKIKLVNVKYQYRSILSFLPACVIFGSKIPQLLNILLLSLLLHATGLMFQLLFLMRRKINLKRPHFAHPNSA